MVNTFPLHDLGSHELQELFLQWDPLEDPNIVRRITRCFPKLTTFAMRNGNDDVLHEIYLTMPFIQKLTILNGGFTDQGITGISEIVYKDIADSGSLSLVDPGKLRTNMSIATLSNLRKLRLASRLITDVSIFLGIGTCSNLQHLHLESPFLTDHCLSRIAKFPQLTNLNLVSCSGLSMQWKIMLREYFRNQGKRVNLEFATVEEVLVESQRRALILPDLSHHFYFRRGLLAMGDGGANGQHPIDAQMDFDSSGTDDDDDFRDDGGGGGENFEFRRLARMERPLERVQVAGERERLFRRFCNQDNQGVVRRRMLFQRVGFERGQLGLGDIENFHFQIGRAPGVGVNGADGGDRNADVRGLFDELDVPPIIGPVQPQRRVQRFGAENVFLPIPQPPHELRLRQDGIVVGIPPNADDFPPPIPIDMAFLEDIEM